MSNMYYIGNYKIDESFNYESGNVVLNITDERDNAYINIEVTVDALNDVHEFLGQHRKRKKGDLTKFKEQG